MRTLSEARAAWAQALEEGAAREALDRGRRAAGIAAVPTLLRPGLLDASMRPAIDRATRAVSSALRKVGRAFFGGDRRLAPFFDRLGPRAAELARLDAPHGPLLLSTRYDAICRPETGEVAILECNSGDPSGLGWVDALRPIFCELPSARALATRFTLASDSIVAAHRAAVLAHYRTFCRRTGAPERERPAVCFLCAADSFVRTDHECMANQWRQAGFEARLVDPRDVTFEGGRAVAGGQALELAVRDTIDEYVTDAFWPHVQGLLEAYRRGAFCLANPFCTTFADQKSTFEVLTDEEHQALFDAGERTALSTFVCETRLVAGRHTTLGGRRVDLPEHLRTHRETFVLKPNEGYGGFGVMVGTEASQADWEKRLDEALAAPNSVIAQRYLPLPTEDFPDAGTCRVVQSFWDFGLDKGCEALFTRASPSTVVNVHQGGGIMPTWFVGPKAPM